MCDSDYDRGVWPGAEHDLRECCERRDLQQVSGEPQPEVPPEATCLVHGLAQRAQSHRREALLPEAGHPTCV